MDPADDASMMDYANGLESLGTGSMRSMGDVAS